VKAENINSAPIFLTGFEIAKRAEPMAITSERGTESNGHPMPHCGSIEQKKFH
jgi:hypothetical protein